MHRTVLGDDAIDKVQVARNPSQFVEDSTRDQQHDDALCARRRNCISDRWVEDVAPSDGPVVVQRDDR